MILIGPSTVILKSVTSLSHDGWKAYWGENTCMYTVSVTNMIYNRDDSRFVPSQSQTALLCNDASHWLGASLQSALYSTCHSTRSHLCSEWFYFPQQCPSWRCIAYHILTRPSYQHTYRVAIAEYTMHSDTYTSLPFYNIRLRLLVIT